MLEVFPFVCFFACISTRYNSFYHIWAIHLPLHFVVTVIFCNLIDVLMQKVTCFTFFSLSFSLLFFLLLLVLIFFVDQMQQATVGSHSIYGVECSFAHSRKR